MLEKDWPGWTGSFHWNSGRKRDWKKEQATQEEHKDVIRSYRKKLLGKRAQLELNLATAVKDNKNCFYEYINNKRQNEKKLRYLLDRVGNVVTKDEEKAEVLNAFFPSAFNRQTSYPLGN